MGKSHDKIKGSKADMETEMAIISCISKQEWIRKKDCETLENFEVYLRVTSGYQQYKKIKIKYVGKNRIEDEDEDKVDAFIEAIIVRFGDESGIKYVYINGRNIFIKLKA